MGMVGGAGGTVRVAGAADVGCVTAAGTGLGAGAGGGRGDFFTQAAEAASITTNIAKATRLIGILNIFFIGEWATSWGRCCCRPS
jgi:hypothetical protein